MTVADFNGDGIPDLVYPNYAAGNVAVRLGERQRHVRARTRSSQPERARIDGCGDGCQRRRQARSCRRTTPWTTIVSVLLGNGNGTFQAAEGRTRSASNPIRWQSPTSTAMASPTSSLSNRGDNTVSVLSRNWRRRVRARRNLSEPVERLARSRWVISTGMAMSTSSTANLGDNTATVLLGNGDGTFSFGSQQSAPASPLAPFPGRGSGLSSATARPRDHHRQPIRQQCERDCSAIPTARSRRRRRCHGEASDFAWRWPT